MKKYFTFNYHRNQIKKLFVPDYEDVYSKERSSRDIFLGGLGLFIYTYTMYVIMYVSIFVLGYPYFSKMNENLRADFEAKGNSSFSLFINSYPWNVLYILASLVIVLIFVGLLSYALVRLLEDDKRSFRAHIGLCLHGLSILLSCLFVVFIFNTIFPFNQEVGVVLFAFLVAIWILMFIIGTYFSTKVFINASEECFGQHRRRAMISWLLPFLFVMYTIFGIAVGI
ncbi:hypothetical protein [Leptospira ryugenii]|uniref:hypothetical protein n=1 Tax=Leptospira ryugenii TaxID=1917863 RepID=UPI000D5981C2|nr:hypothetical protein [Leptospira ryugenii]